MGIFRNKKADKEALFRMFMVTTMHYYERHRMEAYKSNDFEGLAELYSDERREIETFQKILDRI